MISFYSLDNLDELSMVRSTLPFYNLEVSTYQLIKINYINEFVYRYMVLF
jgi:hypothetical protein